MTFEVYALYPNTEKIGTVRSNGAVISLHGTVLGRIDGNGKIRGRTGHLLGRVTQAGIFKGSNNLVLFRMDKKGGIYLGQTLVGKVNQIDKGLPIHFAQWAAGLLLLMGESSESCPASTILDTQKSSPEELMAPTEVGRSSAT